MNDCWLSFPINQDLAIRRFCPARLLEQQQTAAAAAVDDDQCTSYWPPDIQVQKAEEDVINHDTTTFYDHNMLLLQLQQLQLLSSSSPSSSSSHHHQPTTSINQLTNSVEEEEFVDNFFDTDYYYSSPQQDHSLKFDNFSMSICNLDDTMMINEEGQMMTTSSFNVEEEEDHMSTEVEDEVASEKAGLQLVHMLLGCAEAVGCRDTRHALSLLTQLWSYVTPCGDSLQRVSYCFALGLRSRLSILLHNVVNINANGTFTINSNDVSLVTTHQKIEAFHLLHQSTPYTAFAFMAANRAIVDAVAEQGKDSLHIIDLGMEHTLQWPLFITTLLASTKLYEYIRLVRITGIIIGDQDPVEIQSSMKVVIDEARSLGIPMEFSTIDGAATPSLLTRENLKLREGEALFVNSIMHLHKYVKDMQFENDSGVNQEIGTNSSYSSGTRW